MAVQVMQLATLLFCTRLLFVGLCVVLVHIPALVATALIPSLYPLRLALFDPLNQVSASRTPHAAGNEGMSCVLAAALYCTVDACVAGDGAASS
jgi:hypothetical protein